MKTNYFTISFLLIFCIIAKGQSADICDRTFSTKFTYHNNSLNIMQALLTENLTMISSLFTPQLYQLIKCFLAHGTQQMLTHNIFNVSNGYALPNQKHTDFFNELKSMNSCGGYPVNCKRVGISNGSLNGEIQKGRNIITNFPGNAAVLFTTNGGVTHTRTLFTAPGVLRYGWGDEIYNDGQCIYQANSPCDLSPNKYSLKGDVPPADHIPGGYYSWYGTLVENLTSNFKIVLYWMENSCFVSTISALDLNTNDGLLKLSNYSKSQVLADSRFDDIWWDLSHDNMKHTTYNSSLRNFIEDQIYMSQNDSYAQPTCSISGGSTNSGEQKLYKASNSVIIENHTVNSGAQLTLKSGNSIHLKPGFVAKAGSNFSASIKNIYSRNCNMAGYLPQFTPPPRSGAGSNVVQIDTIVNGVSVSFYVPIDCKSKQVTDNGATSVQKTTEPNNKVFIFPNPAEDKTTIVYSNPKRQKISIQLIEPVSGKVLSTIYNGIENEGIMNIPLEVSGLTSGMYIISIQAENAIINEKFIKTIN